MPKAEATGRFALPDPPSFQKQCKIFELAKNPHAAAHHEWIERMELIALKAVIAARNRRNKA
jgi:hypothetical protein